MSGARRADRTCAAHAAVRAAIQPPPLTTHNPAQARDQVQGALLAMTSQLVMTSQPPASKKDTRHLLWGLHEEHVWEAAAVFPVVAAQGGQVALVARLVRVRVPLVGVGLRACVSV